MNSENNSKLIIKCSIVAALLVSVIVAVAVKPSRDQGGSLASLESATATNSVTMAWDRSSTPTPPPVGPPLPAIAGYRCRYGTQSGGPYPQVVDAGNDTIVTINNLTPGQVNFFVAVAYDTIGTEGGRSNEVSYMAPVAPTATPGPPTPTKTPGPTPTVSPAPTASPTPGPTPTPGGPTGITFWTDEAMTVQLPIATDGGSNLDFIGQPNVQPTPRFVWIRTSTNASWGADDSMTWLNTDNPSGMGNGTFLNVRPNAGLGNGTYVGNITISAAGLPAKLLHCKLVVSPTAPSPSPSRTPSPSPTRTPTPPSPSPTKTPSPSPSPSRTPTPTASPSPTRTPTPSPTAPPTPTVAPSPSPTCSPCPCVPPPDVIGPRTPRPAPTIG